MKTCNNAKNWKIAFSIVLMAMTAIVLYASWTMPARFEVLYRVGCFGSSMQEVTYQAKNIYGIDVGEEYTVTELAPYWQEIWHDYCYNGTR